MLSRVLTKTINVFPLWPNYYIYGNKNVDSSKYNNMIDFLKRKSEDYTAKKYRIFSKKNKI